MWIYQQNLQWSIDFLLCLCLNWVNHLADFILLRIIGSPYIQYSTFISKVSTSYSHICMHFPILILVQCDAGEVEQQFNVLARILKNKPHSQSFTTVMVKEGDSCGL